MHVVADWFKELYDTEGINFSVFYDKSDFLLYVHGLWVTIYLTVVTIAISIVIGAIGAWLQGSQSRLTKLSIHWFIAIFRNTPPLVQIYFFYFGLGAFLPANYDAMGIRHPLLNAFQWVIVTLSLYAGAFNVEIFRSGIEAVPRTTLEAAEALGYTRLKAYIFIVLPLAFRVCLPALNNNLINLLKTTTLAYTIAVPDTLYALKRIWSLTENVPEMMTVLLITYLILVGVLVWFMQQIERSLAIPGFGR
jgi:polar amino acid transport system permease protein